MLNAESIFECGNLSGFLLCLAHGEKVIFSVSPLSPAMRASIKIARDLSAALISILRAASQELEEKDG